MHRKGHEVPSEMPVFSPTPSFFFTLGLGIISQTYKEHSIPFLLVSTSATHTVSLVHSSIFRWVVSAAEQLQEAIAFHRCVKLSHLSRPVARLQEGKKKKRISGSELEKTEGNRSHSLCRRVLYILQSFTF